MTVTLTTEEKAEVLDAAADRLKGGRWMQGQIGCTADKDKPVCLAGAIESVLGHRYPELVSELAPVTIWDGVGQEVRGKRFYFSREVVQVEDELLTEVSKTLGPDWASFREDVKYAKEWNDPVPTEPGLIHPIDFNDGDDATSRKVIGVLRRTAKRLRQEAQS